MIPVCPICEKKMSLDKRKSCRVIGDYDEYVCCSCSSPDSSGDYFIIESRYIHNTKLVEFTVVLTGNVFKILT